MSTLSTSHHWVWHPFTFYAETGEPTGVWDVDTGGHKEPCIRCGPDFRREGAFWEGRPRRDAVFRQYSLTTRYR